ncbi:response regulator, partial [Pseudomonas sp. MWU12-2323]|uniref:response regulator n=1 Tax=Pseudomonas sp. MWU12-2323 TaxID=2651296 RepID=UPI00128B6E19
MPHILIVEDEAAIADTLVYALQADGHSTEWVTLAGAAIDQQRQRPADLIILDIGLPEISGFETCRQLRRFTEVPVMFLSARDGEIDRVVGLELGADDYVVKPFSPREVAARVRAILKRMGPRAESATDAALFQLDTLRMQ